MDIHDHISQSLAISRIKLSQAIKSIENRDLSVQLKEVSESLEKTIDHTRSLTFEISPPILYELGFEPTVEWLTEQFQSKYGIPITYSNDSLPKVMDPEIRISLYKVIRELLTNVVKHSQAKSAAVSLETFGNHIKIEVKDNGIGMDMRQLDSRFTRSYGLFSVRERLEYLGGTFRIESAPGKGVTVSLIAPLQKPERKDLSNTNHL